MSMHVKYIIYIKTYKIHETYISKKQRKLVGWARVQIYSSGHIYYATVFMESLKECFSLR